MLENSPNLQSDPEQASRHAETIKEAAKLHQEQQEEVARQGAKAFNIRAWLRLLTEKESDSEMKARQLEKDRCHLADIRIYHELAHESFEKARSCLLTWRRSVTDINQDLTYYRIRAKRTNPQTTWEDSSDWKLLKSNLRSLTPVIQKMREVQILQSLKAKQNEEMLKDLATKCQGQAFNAFQEGDRSFSWLNCLYESLGE